MKRFILIIALLTFAASSYAGNVAMTIGGQTVASGGVADPEDQFSANPVFSVGVTATELDNEGTITVVSNIATFSAAFPTNVGVGDVVQYDVNNGGDIGDNEYGIIRGISSDRTMAYLLKTDGTGVTDTTVTTSVYDIFRAYISLSNWVASTENTNIDADCRDDYGLTDFDLTDGDDEDGPVYVACYGDGADTTKVLINDYTTDVDDYIEIFTPVSSDQVGVSQRHTGIYDTAKYHLTGTDRTEGVLEIRDEFVRINGIQIGVTVTANNNSYGLYGGAVGATNELRVSNSIFAGISMAGTGNSRGIRTTDSDTIIKIWNCVVYGFVSGADNGFLGISPNGVSADIYNTTVNNCGRGIDEIGATVTVTNSLVFENNDDFEGTIAMTYCGSDDDHTGDSATNFVITQTADDYAALVVDADGGDFTLTNGSSEAVGAGTDNPGSGLYSDDILGSSRSSTWDVGAFEN